MKSHVIWSNYDVFALFWPSFQTASRQSGLKLDPKPLQKVSLGTFRKSQDFLQGWSMGRFFERF